MKFYSQVLSVRIDLIYHTAVAPGTVGTLPTVPLFFGWYGKPYHNLDRKKLFLEEKRIFFVNVDVIIVFLNVCSIKCYKIITGELPLLYYQEIGIRSLSAPESVYLFISIN